MKIRSVFLVLLVCFAWSSCYNKAVPEVKKMPEHPYGSFVRMQLLDRKTVYGELISIDKETIVLLDDQCKMIPVSTVKQFNVFYAKPPNYAPFILLFSLLSLSHGWYGILTLPINFAATLSVTIDAENAYVFNNKRMTYEKLKMFARFPQGVPEGVPLERIKSSPYHKK